MPENTSPDRTWLRQVGDGLLQHLSKTLSPDSSAEIMAAVVGEKPAILIPTAQKRSPLTPFEVVATSAVVRGVTPIYSQPSENIRMLMQSKPGTTMRAAAADLYRRQGLSGFYTSAVPSGVKASSRNVYRHLIQVYVPQGLKAQFPAQPAWQIGLGEWAALTLTDTMVNTPFNRIATVRTVTGEPFFKTARSLGLRELYRGTMATMGQQGVSWGIYLATDAAVVAGLHRINDHPTPTQQAGAALANGLIATLGVTPLTLITTLTQRKDNPVPFRELPRSFVDMVKKNGPSAVLTGGVPRLLTGVPTGAIGYWLRRHFEERKKESAPGYARE